MPDDLEIRVRAPGAQETEQSLGRVAQAEGKVSRETRQAGRDSERAARGFGRLGSKFREIAGAFGLGLGIGAAITKIIGLVRQWEQHMESIARLNRQAGQDMVALALMQEPGKIREHVMAAGRIGGKYGVPLGASWSAVQMLQSQTGSFEKGLAAAEEAFRLKQLGVPVEAAAAAVSTGMGLGLTTRRAALAPYAAGTASSLSPAELSAVAGQALKPWREREMGGAEFGYQILAAMTQTLKSQSLAATATQQIGVSLMGREGKVGQLWKRLGVAPGKDPMAQFQALRRAGLTSTNDLIAAGFAPERAQALSSLLGAWEGFENIQTSYAETMKTTLEEERKRAEAEMPEMVHARQIEQIHRAIEYSKTFGPKADAARRKNLEEALRALALQEAGLGWWAGDDMKAGRLAGFVAANFALPETGMDQSLFEAITMPIEALKTYGPESGLFGKGPAVIQIYGDLNLGGWNLKLDKGEDPAARAGKSPMR